MIASNRRRTTGALIIGTLTAATLVGCTSGNNVQTAGKGAQSAECKLGYSIGSDSKEPLSYRETDTLGKIDLGGKKLRIGVVLKTLSNEYWAEVKRGAEAAGKLYGVDVTVQAATDEASTSEQLTVAQTMVNQGFNAYVIAPDTNANLTPAIAKIKSQCKPVIDVIEPGVVATTYIGADERAVGGQAAKYLASVLPKGGSVIHIEGQAGSDAGTQRTDGFTAGAKAAGFKLVANGVGNWNQTQAFNATQQLLQRFPDVAGIYAANDTMALGVAQAVKGHSNPVVVVGTDAIPAAVNLVAQGRMGATNTPFPYYQGCKAVEVAIRQLLGQKVPAWVDSAPTLITRDNVSTLFSSDGVVKDTGSCQPPAA